MPAELPASLSDPLEAALKKWQSKDTEANRLTFLSRLAAVVDAGWSRSAISRSTGISREKVGLYYEDAVDEYNAGRLPTWSKKVPAPPPRVAARVSPGREPVDEKVIDAYAKKLKALQPLANNARGHHGPDAPERIASDKYSLLLKEAADKGIPITVLAEKIDRQVAGLRNRIHTSHAIGALGDAGDRHRNGIRDPKEVEKWAKKIRPLLKATEGGGPNVDREKSERARELIHEAVVENNISLRALAKACGRSYHSTWVRLASNIAEGSSSGQSNGVGTKRAASTGR